MGIRRLFAFLAALVLFRAGTVFAEPFVPDVVSEIAEIETHGNLVLDVTTEDLFALGYAYGDIVTVTVNGQELDMPVGSSYSDVEDREMVCRAARDPDKERNPVKLAVNMGCMADALGIAEKHETDADPGYRWDYSVDTPVAVRISLKEKGGYAAGYLLHQLVRSNDRTDYAYLSDEQYANFREVGTAGMGSRALFRSSSPVNPRLNRSREADEALAGAGVRTVINLIDSGETMKSYEGFDLTHYSRLDVIALSLGVDYTASSFSSGLKAGLEYLASHEGPYLIHCLEGKDRTGFVCAILECLMGASADEVTADYMLTFYYYYGIDSGTEKYDLIRTGNFEKLLCRVFGIGDIRQENLAECAENYLLSIGLDAETIAALKANLTRDYGP